MTDPRTFTPTGKPRARSLGIAFGGTPGPSNAITDVPGCEVGYVTLIQGDDVRTGVTAIVPRGRAGGQRGGRRHQRPPRPALPRERVVALLREHGAIRPTARSS